MEADQCKAEKLSTSSFLRNIGRIKIVNNTLQNEKREVKNELDKNVAKNDNRRSVQLLKMQIEVVETVLQQNHLLICLACTF